MNNEAKFRRDLPEIAKHLRHGIRHVNAARTMRWWYFVFTLTRVSSERYRLRCHCVHDKIENMNDSQETTSCYLRTLPNALLRCYDKCQEKSFARVRSEIVNEVVMIQEKHGNINADDINVLVDQAADLGIGEFIDTWSKDDAKAVGRLLKPMLK